MKCTWTAESSRMKVSVQLGLLCLSLLISSLRAEVETDSMEMAVHFEEPDLHQPEVYRTKRNKSKDKRRKRPPGYNSLLAKGPPQLPMESARVKRDEGAGGKRP